MRIGRWSELRVVRVYHSESIAMCGVDKEMSGEEELVGLVGVSVLSKVRSESVSKSSRWEPRAAPLASLVDEYQAGLWALKSPKIRLSSGGVRSRSREGVKSGGQEEVGGMYILKILMI